MKKIIFGIICLLISNVLISGRISQTSSKIYDANGINFTYPSDWIVNDTNNTYDGFTVIANIENSKGEKFAYFKVSKTNIASNVTLQGIIIL